MISLQTLKKKQGQQKHVTLRIFTQYSLTIRVGTDHNQFTIVINERTN